MAEVYQEKHLLTVLREHRIPLNSNDIGWAFQTSKTATAITNYVDKYLQTDTLLELEEAEIYDQLSSEQQKILRKTDNFPLLEAWTDDHWAAETDHLKNETAYLKEQAEILRAQKRDIDALSKKTKQSKTRKKQWRKARDERWAKEKEQVESMINGMTTTIAGQLQDVQQSYPALAPSQPAQTVQTVLESDDGYLGKLNEYLSQITLDESSDASEDEFVATVEKLITLLVNLTVKQTRLELDRTFAEAHRFTGELPNDEAVEQMESVQQDLETLYPEIADVAGMAITEKYREPLIKDIKERKANEQAAVVARGNWMAEVIDKLTERMSSLESAISHNYAAASALTSFADEMDKLVKESTTPEPESESQAPSITSSPQKGFATPKRMSVGLRSRVQQTPAQALLAHIGIPLPTASLAARTPGLFTPGPLVPEFMPLEQHLKDQLQRQKERILSMDATLGKMVEVEIPASLREFRRATFALDNEMTRESEWGDESTEALVIGSDANKRLAELEASVGDIKSGLHAVTKAFNEVRGSLEKDKIVSRWAR
ncbi:hypothetical protein BJ508DRAFT_410550 [Ascobolus immersus RN42]|uniref:HAUS augmin-like complex subunit 3 N-terminal domain-containing protein n=1 Tax=Ascobolus immersus RN42 TaxID=1160509 RepID=A0A3N4IPK3_ASCIM|nr:hypothetical protein BJ508DRAFT_410550 [Ascobolus immersus RN42]